MNKREWLLFQLYNSAHDLKRAVAADDTDAILRCLIGHEQIISDFKKWASESKENTGDY